MSQTPEQPNQNQSNPNSSSRSNSRLVVLPLALIAALVAAFSIWYFYEYYEQYEETIDNGWTVEAQTNQWLAAQKYMERLGYTFNRYERIEDLAPDLKQQSRPGTVLITDVELILTEKRVAALLDWVKDGGRLIVGLPDSEVGRTHSLLKHFGVTLEAYEEEDEEDSEKSHFVDLMREYNDRNESLEGEEKNTQNFEEWTKDNREQNLASAREFELTTIEFQEEEYSTEVHFTQSAQLDHEWFYLDSDEEQEYEGHYPSYWAASTNGGTSFMEFNEGEGVVSFVSNSDIWDSSKLDKHDHAWFLWQLAYGDSVSLLYGANMPALGVILWRAAPELLSAFGLWLLCWLIYRGRRFGAIREQTFTQRRAIIEHIRACSDYLWRSKKPDALIAPLQNAIHHRCLLLCPGWNNFSPEQQLQWLTQHALSHKTESNKNDLYCA